MEGRVGVRFRATSFGKPVGPWRTCKYKVRQDLIEKDLGSYDEWGAFYITVPGDIEMMKVAPQSRAA